MFGVMEGDGATSVRRLLSGGHGEAAKLGAASVVTGESVADAVFDPVDAAWDFRDSARASIFSSSRTAELWEMADRSIMRRFLFDNDRRHS